MPIRNLVTTPALAIALALMASACGLDRKTVLAPSDATLAVSAPAGFVVVNQSTTLAVSATRTDGSAVPDGTEVTLTATAGEFAQPKVRINNGTATVTYKAGPQFGLTQILARSGDLTATFDLPVASGSVTRVQVAADPGVLPVGGGTADLTAWAFDAGGQTVAGVPIKFETSVGTVSPAEPVITNGDGVAQARLTASTAASVKASAMAVATYEIVVPIRRPVVIETTATPGEPVAGQSVTFTVKATLDGKPVAGPLRVLFGDGQSADLGRIEGIATATHTYGEGGYNVTSVFIDQDGIDTRHTIRLEVRGGNSPGPGPGPGPGPVPSGGDAIDPNSIIWLSPASTNVANWRITSTVTSVDIRGDDVCINHTKAGQWPLVSIDENPPNIEGNPMIVVNIGGQWYGAGFDWFGEGRTCKHMPADEYGRDQIRVPPLDGSWPGPRSGDLVGFLVSTPSSDRIPVRSVNERSNIVLVRWP